MMTGLIIVLLLFQGLAACAQNPAIESKNYIDTFRLQSAPERKNDQTLNPFVLGFGIFVIRRPLNTMHIARNKITGE